MWKPAGAGTACNSGYGLVDASGSFVSDRDSAVGCGPCQAGTISEELIDAVGATFQCKPCAPGYYQSKTASTQCEPCPKGTSASMSGSAECTPCGVGSYQPDTAQTSCMACNENQTTLFSGASSTAECVCEHVAMLQLATCPTTIMLTGLQFCLAQTHETSVAVAGAAGLPAFVVTLLVGLGLIGGSM